MSGERNVRPIKIHEVGYGLHLIISEHVSLCRTSLTLLIMRVSFPCQARPPGLSVSTPASMCVLKRRHLWFKQKVRNVPTGRGSLPHAFLQGSYTHFHLKHRDCLSLSLMIFLLHNDQFSAHKNKVKCAYIQGKQCSLLHRGSTAELLKSLCVSGSKCIESLRISLLALQLSQKLFWIGYHSQTLQSILVGRGWRASMWSRKGETMIHTSHGIYVFFVSLDSSQFFDEWSASWYDFQLMTRDVILQKILYWQRILVYIA